MAVNALDVSFKQVLVDFFEDENFHWHGRLLLIPGPSAGTWIWLTPDGSVQFANLADHRVIPLQRNAPLPEEYEGNMYFFDPLTAQELAAAEARARSLADVLGFTSVVIDGDWLLSDVTHPPSGRSCPRRRSTRRTASSPAVTSAWS